MKKPLSSFKGIAASLALASLLCLPAITSATPVTLTLDSSQSYITLSGSVLGVSFGPQATGSMTDYYSGSIAADLNAGVLTFSGGSSITALNNPTGPFSVYPYPGGPIAGNYGVFGGPSFIPGYNFVEVNGAYTGLSLDIGAGTAQNGMAPSGMMDLWLGGTIVYGVLNSTSPSGPFAPLTGSTSGISLSPATDTSTGLVSWNGNTLVLPITFQTTGGSGRIENWSGELVASISEVPEPSTLALAGMGLLGLAGLQYSRTRRSR